MLGIAKLDKTHGHIMLKSVACLKTTITVLSKISRILGKIDSSLPPCRSRLSQAGLLANWDVLLKMLNLYFMNSYLLSGLILRNLVKRKNHSSLATG